MNAVEPIQRYLEIVAAGVERANLPVPVVRAVNKAANEFIRNSGQKYRLHHDFETYCDLSVVDVGADVYSKHPSCEILMCAYAYNDEAVAQWVPAEDGSQLPKDLEDGLRDPNAVKFAWNKSFEWAIWNHVQELFIPHDQWRDPMVLSYALSLPGSLEKAGQVVELPEDQQKMKRGKLLIRKFCSPRKPTKHDASVRVYPADAPSDWEEFKLYNRTDVEAERAIWKRLRPFDMPKDEWDLWVLDQEINQRGIPINMRMVRNAILVYEDLIADAIEEMKILTGLANPNSTQQLLAWLQERGYPFDDLQKGHVERGSERAKEQIRDAGYSDDDEEMAVAAVRSAYEAGVSYKFNSEIDEICVVRRVLWLRLRAAKASPKKYYALVDFADQSDPDDVRLRNAFQFAGAGRTWRWSGRAFQAQNLPRPATKHIEKNIVLAARQLETLSAPALALLWDDPFDVLTSCIRPAAQAPEGYVFVDADLNAIENRVLGWIAKCAKILRVFELNRDPYIDFSKYLFGGTYEERLAEYKAGDGSKRTISKPGVLGCFGSNTPVLTNRGWKRIVDVRSDDLVHDGTEFVKHGGVAYRGEKTLVRRAGIYVTEDHRFDAYGEWISWQQAAQPTTFVRMINSAIGRLSASFGPLVAQEKSTSAAAAAASNEKFLDRISCGGFRDDAPAVLKLIAAARSGNELAQPSSIFWQIVSTLRERGARAPATPLISITGVGEFVWGSGLPNSGSPTASISSGQTVNWKLIARTMTDTMSRAISDSPLDPSKTEINGHSWDIVNAGTRSSFVVLTDAGPVVAHNCGYMLSAGEIRENKKTGEIEATGLLGYAWQMGIKQFTLEQSKLSVETFRREFEEVKSFWYDIERAAIRCVRTGQPTQHHMIRFDMKPPFLRMILPSGRALHYCRPRLEEKLTPWGSMKVNLTYEGLNDKKQWLRISTHGGKLTENADQAISRDLLANGMKLAWKRHKMPIVLHVHDQLVGLAREDRAEKALKQLQECMEDQPAWAPGLPLGSAGFVSKLFVKD